MLWNFENVNHKKTPCIIGGFIILSSILFNTQNAFAEILNNWQCSASPSRTECYACGSSGCLSYCNSDYITVISTSETVNTAEDDQLKCLLSGGFCMVVPNPSTDRVSETVAHGMCYKGTITCEVYSYSEKNIDGTCKCVSYTSCTTPDYCRDGYVLSNGSCVECPYVNGSSGTRGYGDESLFWKEHPHLYSGPYSYCYAKTGVTYSDTNGSFVFPDYECWYTY